jgi:natural product biosynthesis luciferase-like monooxygenase protein
MLVTRRDHANGEVYPLSPMQQGMLYHYLSDREFGADVIQYVIELREEVDVDRLRRAWNRVAARHQPFRTRFHWGGAESPTQEVLPYVQLDIEELDWRGATDEAREQKFRDFLAADRRRGFDLGGAPAMRLALIRWSDDESRCLWSFPHILMDGHSAVAVLGEVFDFYDRGAGYEPPAPSQYATFLEWQSRRSRDGEDLYWRQLLEGVPGTTPLPGAAEGVAGSTQGIAHRMARLTSEETATIISAAESLGVTLSTVVQGAWALLLAHYAAADDVVFGVARACRKATVADVDSIVGLCINTLPVRARYVADTSVRDWLHSLRRQQVDVRPYEHTPLADIQRWSGFGVGQPLFETAIVFDRAPMDALVHAQRPAWTHRTFILHEPAAIPVTLYAHGGVQLELKLVYERNRLADDTAERVVEHLATLVREFVRNPDRALKDVPVLSEEERRRQLFEWNATERPVDLTRCVHTLIEEQVARTPDAIALADGVSTLSYRELDERANRLAHRLVTMGVQPDARVGVCMERSADVVVAVVGVLKAGGAYVPLDPDYPVERLEYMAHDAGLVALITADGVGASLAPHGVRVVDLTRDAESLGEQSSKRPAVDVGAENLAYVIYTSGSTGRPKGVMIEHRNVVNFFAAMDDRVPRSDGGTWLAVTSLAFDISVLELLWPLTRGFKVVVASPLPTGGSRTASVGGMEFSLFYFASGEDGRQDDKYRLLLEGARFADERRFHAVWTPERHFHAFGGLYPNPSVTAAALATVTSRVRLRAGSVVLPLHHPIRIAEEWALVDNLSGGRVDISFASGWQPNDFALAPESYAERKRIMMEGIEIVRRLWRGESVSFPGPDGKSVEVRTLPRPRQRDLPVWITTAGTAETYRAAGEAGANVLTHLLGQTVDDVAAMIAVYRDARKKAGHPGPGRVTLMLHTFVGPDESVVRETVRKPMKEYLHSSVSLIKGFTGTWMAQRGPGQTRVAGDELAKLSPDDMESLLDFAFERYFETSGLFGTPARCLELVERLRAAGVDEIACLIDFGVSTDEVLAHLNDLDAVRQAATRQTRSESWPALSTLIHQHGVTHLQCTPSLARMMLADQEARKALGALDALLVGGEALPGTLAAELREAVRGPVLNMYGPTETTVWSSVHQVNGESGTVPIGRPIANTRLYVLDRHQQPAPLGVPGELYIGGAGVVRGYLGRPELTAERFLPDQFLGGEERIYRTGDMVRARADGVIEFLGRVDHQVKIRGHRIELGEIEAVIAAHPDVEQVVVNPWQRSEGDAVLVAYVVPAAGRQPSEAVLRAYAESRLPSVMVPSHVVTLTRFPLTPNGKIDRKALPTPSAADSTAPQTRDQERPATALEELVADTWRSVLGLGRVGPRDNFFALGGNSLTTIQVAMRIRESLGIDLPLRVAFEAPTVAELAAYLERRLLESADTNALESLLTELEQPAVGGPQTAPA